MLEKQEYCPFQSLFFGEKRSSNNYNTILGILELQVHTAVAQTNCAFKYAWAREISNTVLPKETIMWVEETTYSKA